MSWDYARQVILSELQKADGNAAAAARAVAEMAASDQRLLLALSAPHMKGIIAHAVQHVITEKSRPVEIVPDAPQALHMPLDEFGKTLLGALSGRNTPRFGQEDAAPRPAHKAASKAHIDTLKMLAKKTDR